MLVKYREAGVPLLVPWKGIQVGSSRDWAAGPKLLGVRAVIAKAMNAFIAAIWWE
jgi:aconitase A